MLTMLCVVVSSACVVVACCVPSVDAVAIVADYFRRVVLESYCAQWCFVVSHLDCRTRVACSCSATM